MDASRNFWPLYIPALMVQKRPKASRRVAWPEPGRVGDSDNEFRLTWGRIAAILTVLAAIVGAFPAYWTISDHFMNRQEITAAMKAHADHDASVQAWNQYGFAANRVEYLDDKIAECEAKKMTSAKLAPVDTALCTRYDAKIKMKNDEAATLKSKAIESTKEKQ